jgi:hypothetical protein
MRRIDERAVGEEYDIVSVRIAGADLSVACDLEKCKIIGRFTGATGAAFYGQINCQKRRHDPSSFR